MKNGWRALWQLVAVLVLAGCATLKQANLSSYDPECFMDSETVPVPLSHDTTLQWRVNAEVDDIPGVFVVDTGADFTVVTPQLAQRLAARAQGEEDQSISRRFHGNRVDFAKIGRFRIGGACYLGFYAPVVNLDHISRATRTRVDGILGNNVLNKTAYEIDWKRDLLTLRSRSSDPPAEAFPVSVRQNRVYLEARINGREAEFALDTGAYRSTLAGRELSRLSIPRENQTEIEAPRIDIHRSEHRKQIQAKLDAFEIGPIRRTNYMVITWENNALGMDLLSDWILKVDARRGWMSLEKPAIQAN
jgi:predicted aspartyl protease